MTPHADAITAAAEHFEGWAYGGYAPDRRRVDCCSFAALVVGLALDLDELQLSSDEDSAWAAANVWSTAKPWSGPEVVFELLGAQGAVLVDAGGVAHLPDGSTDVGPQLPTPGRWHWVQGWRSLTDGVVAAGDRGHTFLWFALSPYVGWVLESQEGVGVVAYRAGWEDRTKPYRAGVAWAVLPEVS